MDLLKFMGKYATLFSGMSPTYAVLFYTFAFISVYVQVFFLVTFLEKKKELINSPKNIELKKYPLISVAVPMYNEEFTIRKTLNSLLNLDYPKDKLEIIVVDDGSKDNTWEVVQEFKDNPSVILVRKENGGKYTAVNLALEISKGEFFGCLDSDSIVHSQSLKRILKYFENDSKTMAVSPSLIVNNPKTAVQHAQSLEYDMGIYTKKMFGFMGGIHVTPGPFSIFRREVFDDLGPYRKAHNTEDQEIALRMQESGYKIDHCPDAYVYTNTPDTAKKLLRQRIRWVYGFMKNTIDYRHMLFKKKYGMVSTFTLPSQIIGIAGVIFILGTIFASIIQFFYRKIIEIKTLGFYNFFNFNLKFNFDWFFINTKTTIFISLVLSALAITSIILGRKMIEGKKGIPIRDFVYFSVIYSIIGPLWVLKAIYNVIISKESNWALEIEKRTK